jgi:hypothetical protein
MLRRRRPRGLVLRAGGIVQSIGRKKSTGSKTLESPRASRSVPSAKSAAGKKSAITANALTVRNAPNRSENKPSVARSEKGSEPQHKHRRSGTLRSTWKT